VVPLTERKSESKPLAENLLREKALKALGALPPFSPILNRLLASLANEEVSFTKLAGLIEKDTVVAGNILHLVNSALYARRGTINSVGHALSLLGINKLRNAVLGMSITRMWNHVRTPASWSMARFNLHSAGTAILSDMLAQRLPVDYPEGAFVAGLLHDVGRLLIALSLPEEHERILALCQNGACLENSSQPLIDCEQQVLGFSHPELSGLALAFWNLPKPIQDAVRDHHANMEEKNSGPLALNRIVAAADQYVNAIGTSDMQGEKGGCVLLESLGMEREKLASLLSDFTAEFEAMTPFFQ
jgi:HD-like signal output (HDOD) protein